MAARYAAGFIMRPLAWGIRKGGGAARPEGGEAGPPETLPDTVTVLSASISPRLTFVWETGKAGRGKNKKKKEVEPNASLISTGSIAPEIFSSNYCSTLVLVKARAIMLFDEKNNFDIRVTKSVLREFLTKNG